MIPHAPAPPPKETEQMATICPLSACDIFAQAIRELPLLEDKICNSKADADALRSLIATYVGNRLANHNRQFSRYTFLAQCSPQVKRAEHAPIADDPAIDEDDAELARYDALDDDLDNPEEDR